MKTFPLRMFYILLFIVVALILWNFRSLFFERTNLSYLKSYYEASQWTIPLSPRIMGDGSLYLYAGSQLVKGADPFSINPEVPPLGKYIYGLSITLFDNPYPVTILFFMLSTAFFYAILRILIDDEQTRLFGLALFLINPLTISQIPQTLLDLPQMTFFLGHVMCVMYLLKKKGKTAIGLALLAGVFLGAFTAVKIGFMVILLILALMYLLWKEKKLCLVVYIGISAVLMYVVVYTNYFLIGHSFIDFLKTQKWVLMFYANSKVHPIPGMELITIMTGLFKGWWNGARFEFQHEWSVILPMSILALFASFTRFALFRDRPSSVWRYMCILTVSLLGVNLVIPFWPRYMLLFFPLLILFFIRHFPKTPVLRFGLLVIVFLHTLLFVSFYSQQEIRSLADIWKQGQYQEMFQLLTPDDKQRIGMKTFEQQMTMVDHTIQIEGKHLEIDFPRFYPWLSQTTGSVSIAYKTPLGLIAHKTPIIFSQIHGKWYIAWDWNIVLNNFDKDSIVTMTLDPTQDGKLITKDGVVLSETKLQQFLSVVPGELVDSEVFIDFASEITEMHAFEIRIRTRVQYLPDEIVPIGFLRPLSSAELHSLKTTKGVVITLVPRRVYNEETTLNTGDITSLEKNNETLFTQHGGEIVLQNDRRNKHMIIKQIAKNGKDIILPQTLLELSVE